MKTNFLSRGLIAAAALALALLPLSALAQQNTTLTGTVIVQPGSVTSGSGGVSYAGTINNKSMLFTTETLTILTGQSVDFTITNNVVSATDICWGSVLVGTTGKPLIQKTVAAAGSLVTTLVNLPTVSGAASITTPVTIGVICFK